jgi:hypothetical protein
MMVKLLLPPAERGGSFVIGVKGQLRMVDPPRKCWGYSTGCTCEACLERERTDRVKRAGLPGIAIQVCVCETARIGPEARCEKCGHRSIQAA